MPQVSLFHFVCPWCGEQRESGAPHVLGPDPDFPGNGPLWWDIECLRNFAWLKEVVTYRPVDRPA